MSKDAFSSLSLKPELLSNLGSLGYEKMTPIQAQSLPAILAGQDVIAQAKTGSGKTAAFGLGVLQHLNVKRFRVQTLILCPTRELADQVAKEIRKLARAIHNIKVLTLCGGMPFGPQIGSLEHGAHIIVGTPGRVEEHVRKGNLSLDDLNLLVLDEADRMLEMGFQDALDAILDYAPVDRQTLLFSATYPKEIEKIAADVMKKPVVVKVAATHDNSSIEQIFYKVDSNQDRLNAVRLLLAQHRPESTVVFCNTKREAQEIADDLEDYGYSAIALHGDLDQRQRDQALVRFSNKSASVMVATDVAARGLDIDKLDCVINYQLARDTEVHVHRIGRTGRAGSQGIACSLYSDNEHYKVLMLEEYLDREIEPAVLPPLSLLDQPTFRPAMVTLLIDGGKRQKIRPGDILGALTGENGIRGDQVGKINVFDYCSYVAVMNDVARAAYKKLEKGKLKGRSCRVRQIRG
ncbi:ATP-dependent RNA helicase DbpA [Photobacterium aphoticum]|uniref:DEAD/DEAH box helicase n=2 Tax=Photobacterium aphoticum TaxID=754436 RepID=A0A0J1GI15_9GAMM|nr:ATP-dependent RNA helicase DbpA [Photobacterium aphoticum]KLU99195.1 DEAD/DEAH box helicase [Photobacterium aphoticum]PSU54896.1 ATP-dependent RNA helicase DbpA [Photobacterium aphoticum]